MGQGHKIGAMLIANPAAGSGPALTRSAGRADVPGVLSELAAAFDIERHTTQYPGHATELAMQAARSGVPAVFALGGDGTAREVAAGLLHSETALGILPAGTTNVLAPALQLPLQAQRCAALYCAPSNLERLREGRLSQIDVGTCGERTFLMMASRGFDAEVLHHLPSQRKQRFGRLGILGQGVRELARRPTSRFRFSPDGRFGIRQAVSRPTGTEGAAEEMSGGNGELAGFLALCNIARYGGPFRLVPGASPFDGQLDLLTLATNSRLAILGLAMRAALGWRRRPGARLRSVTAVALLGEGDARLQLDGDAVTLPLPLVLRVLPRALRLLQSHEGL